MLLKIKLANTWPFRFKNFKDLDLVSRPALFFSEAKLSPTFTASATTYFGG
jgi:hypothetical protein